MHDVEEAEAGVLAGLRESGLVEGRDYVVTMRNAQGDMATVNASSTRPWATAPTC